jgi:hypothetical protein
MQSEFYAQERTKTTMSDAQTIERRAYSKKALDVNGRHDLSKQVQHLWNACAGAGGNWADLSHVKAKRSKK